MTKMCVVYIASSQCDGWCWCNDRAKTLWQVRVLSALSSKFCSSIRTVVTIDESSPVVPLVRGAELISPLGENKLDTGKMGSDPQYSKYPNLSHAQDIFVLTNRVAAESSKRASLKSLQNAITEEKMAPLYRYLAHPTEGILNASGEGSSRRATSRKANSALSSVARRRGSATFDFPWDQSLYEKLVSENEEEEESLKKEEEEAEEKAGDSEVQAAKGKRAEFFARTGDKVSFKTPE